MIQKKYTLIIVTRRILKKPLSNTYDSITETRDPEKGRRTPKVGPRTRDPKIFN